MTLATIVAAVASVALVFVTIWNKQSFVLAQVTKPLDTFNESTLELDYNLTNESNNSTNGLAYAKTLHRSKSQESVLPLLPSSDGLNHTQIPSSIPTVIPFASTEIQVPDSFEKQTNDEKRLLQYLMRNYDPNVRPLRDSSAPVIIRLGITLTQIFDLDEKNQVLTTNVWLDQEWIDEFLVWPSGQFGNLTKIRIPCEKIWLPDIVLYNSADDYTRGYMNSRAMIQPTGNVFWPPPAKFRSTCQVDVTYFPFDDQTCIMKLGSWIYDGLQVDILNRTAEVDLSNYVANGEWHLLDAQMVRNVVYYSCCPEPFPDVTVTLKIRRKTLYYMYNVVFPCLMMSALTLLVFCLPPDSGEKIALGVTVLLAFSVFMLAISEKLPETSESIPLLGIYLTAVMMITSVSVIMTVIVINIHYRGPSNRFLPHRLRRFLLIHVMSVNETDQRYPHQQYSQQQQQQQHQSSPCFHHQSNSPAATSAFVPPAYNGDDSLLKSQFKTPEEQNTPSASLLNEIEMKIAASANSTKISPATKFCESSSSGHRSPHKQATYSKDCFASETCASSSKKKSSSSAERCKCLNCQSKCVSSCNGKCKCNTNSTRFNRQSVDQMLSQTEESLQILRYLLYKHKSESDESRTISEWRLLALAVDKILFWIFFVVIVFSSCFFLIIIPARKRGVSFIFS